MVLAGFMVVMSIATAYVVPTSSSKGGDVIPEQAQKRRENQSVQHAYWYSCSADRKLPQLPATTAPAAEDSAN